MQRLIEGWRTFVGLHIRFCPIFTNNVTHEGVQGVGWVQASDASQVRLNRLGLRAKIHKRRIIYTHLHYLRHINTIQVQHGELASGQLRLERFKLLLQSDMISL